jgi:PAS domain S-box-containing protein
MGSVKDTRGKQPGGGGEGEGQSPAQQAHQRTVAVREETVGARETAMSSRELSMSEREELARLRDDALRLREEVAGAEAAQARILDQMREANEKLVLATLHADELAEQADAGRRAIADSEERFRTLVTASAAVIWYANAEGRIHVDPDSWRAFTGLDVDTQQEAPGWLHAVHPDDRAAVLAAWARASASGSVYHQRHRLQRHDGTHGWVVAHGVPIRRAGAVSEWIGTLIDVNDRVLVEEARERFIAILGHDLRTPLSAIVSGAELLERAWDPKHFASTVERIARSARRMEAMIRDVLDFARGRLGGGIPIQRESCDLGRIVCEEVDETRLAFAGRDIRCVAKGDLAGEWDPSRIEQLITNLIANAVQHGADPISVTALDDGDAVILRVHNQGPAIAGPLRERLFEPFHGTTRRDADGLGLGLYIASEIVRAHCGAISVSSAEGDGTTFSVRLPRQVR